MSWLGLDPGAKRTGVALSRSGYMTEPLAVVSGDSDNQVGQILELVKINDIQTIVVGRPPQTGDSHPATRLLQKLKNQLASQSVTITTVDETLTSKEAERLLRARGQNPRQSDALAAQLILEQYLTKNLNDQI